jgi:cytochrome c biogenesis protein CcmG/thiol:disulfide interchange protein DsbE
MSPKQPPAKKKPAGKKPPPSKGPVGKPTKKPAAKRPASTRPSGSSARTRGFPVFWVALGAVLLIAVIAVVASSGGDDGSSSGGSGTGHEYGPVKVTGDPLPRYAAGGQDPAVGDTIPTVAGENFSGTPLTIAPDGKAQLVVFLAHWCPHCNAEAPKLAEYLRDNGGVPADVTLTLVATGSQDTAPNWPPSQWVKDMDLGGVPVLVDDREGTAAGAFGLSAYPFIVAVDSDGKVVDRRSGEQEDGFFAEAFTALADGSAYPA